MKKLFFICLLAVSSVTNASLITFNASDVSGFGGQAVSGGTTVSSDGITIEVFGNYWADITLSSLFSGLPTNISFDFQTDNVGELHGFGFSANDTGAGGLFFQLGGTQSFGIQDNRISLVNGSLYNFDIDLSNFDLSLYDRLVLINDKDSGNRSTNSIFSNMMVQVQQVPSPSTLLILLIGLAALVRSRR